MFHFFNCFKKIKSESTESWGLGFLACNFSLAIAHSDNDLVLRLESHEVLYLFGKVREMQVL